MKNEGFINSIIDARANFISQIAHIDALLELVKLQSNNGDIEKPPSEIKNMILTFIKNSPAPVSRRQISKQFNIPGHIVTYHLMGLKKKGVVELVGYKWSSK